METRRDGARVLDCIEFDDQLRWEDALADVAFLAMDLERLQTVTPDTVFVMLQRTQIDAPQLWQG